jgi:hypothetical protein
MTHRAPFPTLTEDDVREQCERSTSPPPVPITDLVQRMMDDVEGERPTAPPPHTTGEEDVQLDELPELVEAGVLDEIGEAYLERLGPRWHIPFIVMTRDEALRVPLDHWAGFVLSLVDGAASIDEILDASSMPEHEALRLLSELREQGLIDVRPPR